MPDLITILGPTATGKTQLAVHLADLLEGEIISADSRQVYRGMDIGTGKDLADYKIKGKTIPYHLVDIADPGTEYNVFAFQRDFLKVYPEIKSRQHLPVLCGGTGLYLDSILGGYRLQEVPENKALRSELKALSLDELVIKLASYGPLHNTTDTTNRERTIRAIEIKEYEKAHTVKEKLPEIHSVNIGVHFERNELRKRITKRLQQRIDKGMLKEVETLLTSGITPEQLMFYGLEYRFVTQFIIGEIDYGDMFARLNTAIHQFAKRQLTWFRRMEKRGIRIHWIDGTLSMADKLSEALKYIDPLHQLQH
jgi:tRNA dimethylallyltransferase